jgi:hypothetical protein
MYRANEIFDEMRAYAGDPDGIFVGPSERLDALVQRIRLVQER